ncbi:MAG TPA: hypothetical protein PK299_09585 [Anaerolineales bacterium]|nr:hypothetical protein [Anaerolineales bacterium]
MNAFSSRPLPATIFTLAILGSGLLSACQPITAEPTVTTRPTQAEAPSIAPTTTVVILPTASMPPIETPSETAFATATNAPQASATPLPTEPKSTESSPLFVPTVVPAGSINPNANFEYGAQIYQYNGASVTAVRRARMQWSKQLIFWQPGLPAENFSGAIEEAHQRGLKLMYTIHLPTELDSASYLQELGWFIGALAYHGVDAIQVGDTPNSKFGWMEGKISADLYRDLLKVARREINTSGKSPLLISAALLPSAEQTNCDGNGCDDLIYLQQLQQNGALESVDCVGIRSISSLVSPSQTSGDPRPEPHPHFYYLPTLLQAYMNVVGSKSLCLTELGYLSGEEWGQVPAEFQWAGASGLPVEKQKLLIAESIEFLLYQPNVRLAILYNLDYERYDTDPQAGFALIRPSGDCPACGLLRQVIDQAYPIAKLPHPTPMPVSPDVKAEAWNGQTNFQLGGQVGAFGENTVNVMKDMQMGWVKHQIIWHPGANPADFVFFIENAHAKGFKVLLSVKGLPWDTRTDTFAYYATFVAMLGGFGADAIEIWNEPNLPREWQEGRVGVENYLQLLRIAYSTIKTHSPETYVISGGLAPTGFFNGCTPSGCDDLPFLQQFVAAGGLDYTDCVGVHYNEGLVSPLRTDGDPRAVDHHGRYYQTLVDTYWQTIEGKRPLCFTELGFLSGEEWGYLPQGFSWRGLPFVGGINLTVAQQAEYLGEAVLLSRQQGKVQMLFIWNVDSTVWTDDPQAGYAMIRPNGQCPACATVQSAMQD